MDSPKPKKGNFQGRLLILWVVMISLVLIVLVWWYYNQRIEALNQIIEK